MKLRAYRFSVVFLLACWAFVSAAIGVAGSFGIYPEIVGVEPSAQRVGQPITITVRNVSIVHERTTVQVTIGGEPAEVTNVETRQNNISGYLTAKITAVVPRTLTGPKMKPVPIEVKLMREDGRPSRYNKFYILPEAPVVEQPKPTITIVDPPVQRAGERITLHVTGLPKEISPKDIKVTIGGQPAYVTKALETTGRGTASGTITAVITAEVPKTLSASNLRPAISISVAGLSLRYRGEFSIVPLGTPGVPPDQPGSEPTILLVQPEVQQKGYPITIQIRDPTRTFPDSAKFTVNIGGEPAEVTSAIVSGSDALITAVVPDTLSGTDLQPAIYVSGQGQLLRYEGAFSIQQEVAASVERGPVSALFQRLGRLPTWLLIAGAGVVVFVVVFAYIRRKRSLIDKKRGVDVALADGLEPIDIPDPPPELIASLRGNKCTAVLGPGMSVEAGLTTRASLLNSIIEETLDPAEAPQYLRLLEAGRLDDLADSLNSVLPAGTLANQIALLVKKQKPRSATPFFRLAELPVSAVVSLNLDDLAAKAFRKRQPPIFVPREAERCLDSLSRDEFFIFMPNGTAEAPDEILLSQKNLKDAISRNDAFRDLLSRLYYTRPLFFLGMSLSGLQSFLQMIDLTAPPAQRHFALVEVNDSTWQPIAKIIEASYGLSVMPFTPDKREGAIVGFLRKVGTRLGSVAPSVESTTDGKIGRLELRNIGPFKECNLEMHPSWTVILGDNGVGKSTVLRALAVCIGGKATEVSAARLLRNNATLGSITLHIGGHSYPTTIRRKSGGGVTIESQNGVPLDRGGVLAVGFSALRTVGWHRGKATEDTPQRPNAADLIPLTSEEPDPRLDSVKEWIVRLDHQKGADGVSETDRERYEALYRRVFELLGRLAEGVFETEPGIVNPTTREITIKTKDGPIPFESLSQGTLSLVGWTGALMQRLYETAPAGVDPLKLPAIVLVDEVDAHMHPAWQQTLVERLSGIFENAQFIVTSHSPLVVGGLEPTQVYRFKRDAEGVVQISQPEYSLKGLGAAGLLTSGLFDLASHLDTETSKALDRKRQLTAKILDDKKLSGDESKELGELEEKVANLDFTSAVRDPMYKRFVDAISKAEAEDQEGAGSAPIVLTAEEKQKKAELAEKIVRKLKSEADNASATAPQEGSPS